MSDLRKIVDDATPGPWRYDGHDEGYDSVKGEGIWTVCDAMDRGPADATFIATFDPPLVSALLDVAEFMRENRDTIGCANTYDDLGVLLDRLDNA